MLQISISILWNIFHLRRRRAINNLNRSFRSSFRFLSLITIILMSLVLLIIPFPFRKAYLVNFDFSRIGDLREQLHRCVTASYINNFIILLEYLSCETLIVGLHNRMLDEIAFLVSISIKVKFGATGLPIYQLNTFDKRHELQLQHK